MKSNREDEIEKKSKDQYGRTVWNIEAYKKDSMSRKSAQNRDVNNFEGKFETSESKSYLTHRSTIFTNSISSVQTHNLLNPLDQGEGNKRKRFGFLCHICNLSFKDTLSLIDHINSPQHISKVKSSALQSEEQSQNLLQDGVERASISQVRRKLEQLIMDMNKETTEVSDFRSRVKARLQFEKKKRDQRRKRKRKTNEKRTKITKTEADTELNSELLNSIGFTQFGTTKN